MEVKSIILILFYDNFHLLGAEAFQLSFYIVDANIQIEFVATVEQCMRMLFITTHFDCRK